MFDTIGGLPLHPLIVHATEVIVPAAAVVVLLAALWPRFRRWAYALPVLLAGAALVLTPLSTESGEQLEHRVGESDLIERHSHLAHGLIPWVIVLFLVSAGVVWWAWRERRAARVEGSDRAVPVWLPIVLAVLAVVTSAGTTVQAVLVGHSGATAVWQEDMQSAPAGGSDSDG